MSITEWELDYRNFEVLFMGHKTDFPEGFHDLIESLQESARYNASNLAKRTSPSFHVIPH
jgi:hypothetical protein